MLDMKRLLTVGSLSLVFTGAGFAQNHDYDTPYSQSHTLQSTSNQAQLITSTRLHPEVEISRELHAQPVWPWMAKVVIGGAHVGTENAFFTGLQRQFSDGGTILHTWIDPLQKLDGINGLDSDHSLVRAQRRHLQHMGVTTSQLADIKNASVASQPRGSIANHALIIIPPQHESNTTGRTQTHKVNFTPQQTSAPSRLIMPNPHRQPDATQPNIPSVPRQTPAPDKSVASAE